MSALLLVFSHGDWRSRVEGTLIRRVSGSQAKLKLAILARDSVCVQRDGWYCLLLFPLCHKRTLRSV